MGWCWDTVPSITPSTTARSCFVGSLPPFDDRQAKLFALRSFFDRTIPGRWDDLRSVRDDELDKARSLLSEWRGTPCHELNAEEVARRLQELKW